MSSNERPKYVWLVEIDENPGIWWELYCDAVRNLTEEQLKQERHYAQFLESIAGRRFEGTKDIQDNLNGFLLSIDGEMVFVPRSALTIIDIVKELV